MPLDEWEASPTSSPEAAAATRDLLGRLGSRERTLLELVYVAGFSHAEVAAMAGTTPGAVKTAVYRARRALQDLIEGGEA